MGDFPFRALCSARGCDFDARYDRLDITEAVRDAHERRQGHRVEILSKASAPLLIDPASAITPGKGGDRG